MSPARDERRQAVLGCLEKQLANLLSGWPVGEPCHLISDDEAAEMAKFIARSIEEKS